MPRSVTVTIGDGKLTLNWAAPSSWGTWTAAGYLIDWKLSSASSSAWAQVDGDAPSAAASSTSYVFSGANGTSYDLRILAYAQQPSTDGSSSDHFRFSSSVTVSNKIPLGPPEAPEDVSLTAGVERLDVSWTAPATGGSAITGYDLHYKTWNAADSAGTGSDPSTGWIAASHSGTTATGSVTGLTGSEAYYVVRVRAKNAQGNGPWSDSDPVWSAQLTVGDQLDTSNALGCQNEGLDKCSSTSFLTSNTFSRGGVAAQVRYLADAPAGLIIQTGGVDPGSLRNMTLCVDKTAYAFSDAVAVAGLANAVRWASVDAGWSDGDQVFLRIQNSSSCAKVTQRSSDADLSGLTASSSMSSSGTFSALTLTPSTFSASTTSYTATVANTITHVKLTPTVNDTGKATVTVQGTTVTSGSASGAIALSVGSNALTVRVTAENGSTTKDYTVTITRQAAQVVQSSNANLSGLTVSTSTSSTGSFTALNIGTFAASTTTYTATVANARTHAKLTPTVAHSQATVTVQGTTVSSGSASGAIALSVGSNALTVRVTAQDSTTKDYTVTITRQAAQSSNANLSGLTASSSTSSTGSFTALTLTPSFSAATTNYTATVANARTHAKLTPTVAHSQATVTVQGTTVSSGSASTAIALSEGANALTVRVTAQDSTTTKDYTVTITRQAQGALPTVSLSASPNPVREGSPVTVTATLSAARSSAVTIPVTITDNTAESADHGSLTGIMITSGATSGTGTITTNQDDDEDDETFTVALGSSLPSGVTAGSPSSVQVRISDDDKPFALSVDATPACGTTVADTSVEPQTRLVLTPAPATELAPETATEYRPIDAVGAGLGRWLGYSPIRTVGRSSTIPHSSLADLRRAFPGFTGFEFRLKNYTGVTAQCTWNFGDDDGDDGGGSGDDGGGGDGGGDGGGGGSGGGGNGGSGGGGGGGGFGGGGAPLTAAPSAPRNLTAIAGDGQVVLSWEPPLRDGGADITDYEYRNVGRNPWTSTGSTDTAHTVSGLVNDTTYLFEVRAVNRAGKSFASNRVETTPEAPELQVFTLGFPHFANGGGITSDVVLLNAGGTAVRPVLYFSDQQGDPIEADSVVDVTDNLEVADDGGLRVRTPIEPLGELTVATHGRGQEVSGSVRVVAEGAPLGGVLRYGVPMVGVTGVGAGRPVRDALFPARRKQEGVRTAAALHNPGEEAIEVNCELMSGGEVLEEAAIPLEPNGQASWFLEDEFTMADTTDFTGTVRCRVAREERFTGLAVEVDAANRIFTTLPLVEVERTAGDGEETVLHFAHFANGGHADAEGIRSELVFVNVETRPSGRGSTPFHPTVRESRPAVYFYDTQGEPIDPESLLDLTGGLEVSEDGALTIGEAMAPLGELTVATHGRGEEVSGSVKVVSEGPIGGVLRYRVAGVGVTGVGAGPAVRDALFPVRRKAGGIRTAAAMRNLGAEAIELTCRLMSGGAVLEEAQIPLAGNGQESWFIEEAFDETDTTDFTGTVRCTAPGEGSFTGLAVEVDGANRIFTTLPVVPLEERGSGE